MSNIEQIARREEAISRLLSRAEQLRNAAAAVDVPPQVVAVLLRWTSLCEDKAHELSLTNERRLLAATE